MDDLLKCNGCLVKYNDERVPKLLLCGHSLCTACVQRFTENQRSCPECNKREPVRGINDYALNHSLLRFVRTHPIKDVHIGSDSVALLSKIIDREHDDAWNCGIHKSPIILVCYSCTSWVCQDCLVVDHPIPPRGTCRVIELLEVLRKIKCKFKDIADEISKDIESMKKDFEFDMSMHDYSLEHCTKERSHLRIIKRVEDLTEGERENNESVVQDARDRLKELTNSDITASPEKLTSTIQALFSYKKELIKIKKEEKERLRLAIPPIRRHLRLELKRLAESTKALYAVANEGEKTMLARISVKDQRMLVYSLQEGKPPEDSVTVPYGFIKSLIPKRGLTVFFEIGTAEETFGRAYVLILGDREFYLRVNQIMLMCTGEKGISYKNTIFYKYEECGLLCGGDYENNDGTGGRAIVEGIDRFTSSPYEELSLHGVLAASLLSARFNFHLRHQDDIAGPYIGRVHDGLNHLKAVSKLEPVTKGVVRDCGVVIPIEPKYCNEKNCMDYEAF